MVQRFKVAFILEIWLSVWETGRFVLYPGDSRIIQESWHEYRRDKCDFYISDSRIFGHKVSESQIFVC